MCGFVVVVDRARPVDPGRLSAALALLAHRGPDGSRMETDTFTARHGGPLHVGLGHARLSIIDPDPRSSQPFRDGSRSLVYNGELYDHRTLAAGLAREGDM
ncbi:MAG: hypothetical protein ACRC7C_11945, partial [Beijerinckiaceae bacterium]